MKMKVKHVKTSFILRFSIILAAIGFLTFSIFLSVKTLQDARHFTKGINSVISTLYQSEVGHYTWIINLRETISGQAAFTGSTDETQCTLGKHLYSSEVQNNSDVSQVVSELEPLHKEIHNLANQALALISTDRVAAEQLYETEIKPSVHDLSALLNSAIASRENMIVLAEDHLAKVMTLCVALVAASLLAAILGCCILFMYVKKQIGDPILHIAKTAHNLSKGLLDLNFSVNTQNEVGELGQILNFSVAEIFTYVQDIDRAMEEFASGNFDIAPSQPFIGDFKNIETSITHFVINMSHTLQTISQSADQVSAGSGQIAGSAQSMSQGATEQAGSIEELAASITEISSHIKNTANNADEVANLVNLTGEKVSVCNEQMENMVSAMSQISEKSTEIGKIVKTIEDIAFQTNILALNAAVEAARAGSAGKGFAVVADEVRSLAAKSAVAAKNTTQLIEDTVKAVANGEHLAKLTAVSLGDVVIGAQKITSRVHAITEAATEQSHAADQITTGIQQISEVVQTNSATAEESAAASEELSSQALTLNGLVGRFKIKSDQLLLK